MKSDGLHKEKEYDIIDIWNKRVTGWIGLHSMQDGGGAYEEQIQF